MGSEPGPGEPRFRAVLLDMDGVVADTLDWIRDTYLHTAERFGFTATDEVLQPLYGRPLRSCYEALYPDGDLDHCIEVHRAFQAGLMHLIRPFPGMAETLVGLRDAGVRTAVVTSRSIRSARVTLERLGLWGLLDTVVTPEDTQRHKPDPEPLLLAAIRLGARPAECLMVGDTENDLAAGRAAGMATCGVTYGFLGEGILTSRPTYQIACPEGLLDVVGVAR